MSEVDTTTYPLWAEKEYLVGINYFAGWWRQRPNKYVVDGKDWRSQYPERIALLGCYNDQETMDAEIIAAAENGVDFFQMLWYVEKPQRHEHSKRLNICIKQYLTSPENYRMRFVIEFCNHPPFEILEDELWEESCDEWVESMKHPNYLRIGGKALFKVHGFHYFIKQNDNNAAKVASCLAILREKAELAGVGPLLIGTGVMPEGVPGEDVKNFLEAFDYLATYMDVPDLPISENDYPYELLLRQAEIGWKNYAEKSLLPYMPYVPAGWNPRPWKDKRPSFSFPDRNQWEKALNGAKQALDTHIRLRLPDGTEPGQKIFNIYAWNEFGEGGIVAPTTGDDWMKLEVIKDTFGTLETT